jgi:hypothetical protein
MAQFNAESGKAVAVAWEMLVMVAVERARHPPSDQPSH